MSDSIIQLPADGTGKKVDTEQLTVGANTVHRERHQWVGAAANEIAGVKDTDPATSQMGGVVRVAGGTNPRNAVGYALLSVSWQALPATLTALSAVPVALLRVVLWNNNAEGTLASIRLTDGNDVNILNRDMPGATQWTLEYGGIQIPAGLKWSSGAGIFGAVLALF